MKYWFLAAALCAAAFSGCHAEYPPPITDPVEIPAPRPQPVDVVPGKDTIQYVLDGTGTRIDSPDLIAAANIGQGKFTVISSSIGLPEERVLITISKVAPGPSPGPSPGPGPVPPSPFPIGPSAGMQKAATSLKMVMGKADAAKASVWQTAWKDYLAVLEVSSMPKTLAAFKESNTTFMNAAASKANLAGAFPGFSAALEIAHLEYFGTADDAALDPEKAKDFIRGVIWACER